MPKLSSLPEELLCKISHFVHPGTVVSWAGTCKVLWRCSVKTLEAHRKRWSELHVVHDCNPITIPSLLRNTLSEPDILWYVRSFDIWDVRENFEEWKSPRLRAYSYFSSNKEFLKWLEKHHDYSHLDATFYTDEELERYRNMLSNLLRFQQPLIDQWMERLRSGSDEAQKVLLIAMSPRLKKATIVCWRSWDTEERSRPFRMLASILRSLASLPSPQWPYFQNLKTVFVGHYTPLTAMDEYYHPDRVIAPLFLLPAVQKLHLNSLKQEQTDGNDGEIPEPYIWEWEKGRSSCQELTCKLSRFSWSID